MTIQNANGVDNGMAALEADKEWDLLEMKAEHRSRAIQAWMEQVEWSDVMMYAPEEIERILVMLDSPKVPTEKALEALSNLKYEWAKWMVDLDGVR